MKYTLLAKYIKEKAFAYEQEWRLFLHNTLACTSQEPALYKKSGKLSAKGLQHTHEILSFGC